MIRLKRQVLINKLQHEVMANKGGYNNLINDALNGSGDQAMAYLVKQGKIKFPHKQVRKEVNHMVEVNLITIGQWEQMISLLDNCKNGLERVTNFLKRKRRIVIV